MKNFITLTNIYGDEPVIIRVDSINLVQSQPGSNFEGLENYTGVTTNSGITVSVKESPSEIIKMMEENPPVDQNLPSYGVLGA